MIFPSPRQILHSTQSLPRVPLIPFLPIGDADTRTFITYMTTFDPMLGYPILHRIAGTEFYWFTNPMTMEFLYYVFIFPRPTRLLGIIETVALPDGSAQDGPLVVCALQKFAFALAWVSFRQ